MFLDRIQYSFTLFSRMLALFDHGLIQFHGELVNAKTEFSGTFARFLPKRVKIALYMCGATFYQIARFYFLL